MPGLLQALQPRNVAVFRALQLGDMLCAVPALRALRACLPGARITLIGLPWAKAFAARFGHYLDDFLGFRGFPGLPEQPPDMEAFAALVAQARARRFDLTIQMHGNGAITNGLVAQFGALRTAGFCSDENAGGGFSLGFSPYPARGPEIRRLLHLAHALGALPHGDALEFPITAGDESELAGFAAERHLPAGPSICLHPGARSADKRWPPAVFAAVGDALHSQYGLPIVLTGSEAERPLTAAVRRAMRAPAADAAGPISAGALAAQISRARLLVTNDTGVSHIAAALRVPSVIVFMASDMERWAPLNPALHRTVWDPAAGLQAEVLAHARSLLDTAPCQSMAR